VNPTHATALDLREAIVSGACTARGAAEACMAQIRERDEALNSFLALDEEGALAAADAVDTAVAAGETPGRLAGVPVALKDNLCQRGVPTTCASRMLETYRPPYEARAVELLRREGAVILGRTNLDEFAMGSSTENSARGATRNPWDTARTPGGSSGGSAAAVAAGFVPVAIGSDTGGSIRQPAALCGCVGFKPTYGMVSRYGLVAFGSSLDQIGPFARNVPDAALLMDCLAGHDPRDATSSDRPAPDFTGALGAEVRGLRVGVPVEYFGEGLAANVEEKVRAAIDALAGLGAEIVEVSLPHTKYAVPVYYVVATAEASSNLARYDGVHYGYRSAGADETIKLFTRSRSEALGPEVKRRIMLGTYALSAGYYDAYYLRALKVRTRITEDFTRAFESVDVLMAPTTPTTAFELGAKVDDPLAMYLSDIYTLSVNLSGVPAVSLPCGESEGLPVGVQVMGDHFQDATVLAVAEAVERALGSANRIAPPAAV
jgi:aspartyl-tRNA(Asn)/glutamyl-tRNA(Gln) amidotransferase subunit A